MQCGFVFAFSKLSAEMLLKYATEIIFSASDRHQ
jgi:hypothetical protein